MCDNRPLFIIATGRKTGIALPEVLNAHVSCKSVVSVGFGERDAKNKDKIITFNMMNKASSEEKTFNRVVCSPTENLFLR